MFWLLIEIPSMVVISIHKATTDARGEYYRPLNIWLYRLLGVVLVGSATMTIALIAISTGH
jgi:hypothetical protein